MRCALHLRTSVDEDDQVSYEVIGERDVAVPTHAYKIVVDQNTPNVTNVLAFMIPNTEDVADDDYRDYLVSVDSIEAATGVDFLTALSDETEAQVEQDAATSVW